MFYKYTPGGLFLAMNQNAFILNMFHISLAMFSLVTSPWLLPSYVVLDCTILAYILGLSRYLDYNNVVMSSSVSGLLSSDQSITIDMAIQQLQALTPHWWCLGVAAGVQRTTLKEVSVLLFGSSSVCVFVYLYLNSRSIGRIWC